MIIFGHLSQVHVDLEFSPFHFKFTYYLAVIISHGTMCGLLQHSGMDVAVCLYCCMHYNTARLAVFWKSY